MCSVDAGMMMVMMLMMLMMKQGRLQQLTITLWT